jgi:hypothetical protein
MFSYRFWKGILKNEVMKPLTSALQQENLYRNTTPMGHAWGMLGIDSLAWNGSNKGQQAMLLYTTQQLSI